MINLSLANDQVFIISKQAIKFKMHWLISYIWNVGIAIGPVLGYVYQYRLIQKNNSVGTFSIKLCGMLLFCNILRIGFYFSTRYSSALLVQSVLMIIVQLFLLKLCVKTMVFEGKLKSEEGNYDQQGIDLFNNFWNWPVIRTYYFVTGLFAIAVFFVSYTFESLGISIVGQLIGFLSLISESLLMLPQVLQNCKQKKVKGLSHLLVALNNIGDIMKFAFFIVNDQPVQFILCGVIQIFIDGFVIVQILYYKSKATKAQAENTPSEEVKVQTDQKISQPPQIQVEQIQLPENYKQFQDQT